MSLSIAIQNHPKRAALAAALAESIDTDVEIVVDPDPDHAIPSPWRTYRHALERTPVDATHRLILQDDVEVCSGFAQATRAAVQARPNSAIAFFVAGRPAEFRDLIRHAAWRDNPWAECRVTRWTPTIALCLPRRMIQPLLDFDAYNRSDQVRQPWPVQFRADDEIIGRFMVETAEPLWVTVPSLVQHQDVELSLVGLKAWGGADEGRVAACWIGDCDATSIDWTA